MISSIQSALSTLDPSIIVPSSDRINHFKNVICKYAPKKIHCYPDLSVLSALKPSCATPSIDGINHINNVFWKHAPKEIHLCAEKIKLAKERFQLLSLPMKVGVVALGAVAAVGAAYTLILLRGNGGYSYVPDLQTPVFSNITDPVNGLINPRNTSAALPEYCLSDAVNIPVMPQNVSSIPLEMCERVAHNAPLSIWKPLEGYQICTPDQNPRLSAISTILNYPCDLAAKVQQVVTDNLAPLPESAMIKYVDVPVVTPSQPVVPPETNGLAQLLSKAVIASVALAVGLKSYSYLTRHRAGVPIQEPVFQIPPNFPSLPAEQSTPEPTEEKLQKDSKDNRDLRNSQSGFVFPKRIPSRKSRTDTFDPVKYEAELKAQEEAKQKKIIEEAKQKAKEAAEQKIQEEARQKAQEKAEKKAQEAAKQKAQEVARLRELEEAKQNAEEAKQKKAMEATELESQKVAMYFAKKEARLARRADRLKAQEEAEQKAKAEAEQKAKAEAEQKAKAEAEQIAKEEAAQKAKEEAALKAQEAAEQKAKAKAELIAKDLAKYEAIEKMRAAERKKKMEQKAKVQAEQKVKVEAEQPAFEVVVPSIIEEAEQSASEEAQNRVKEVPKMPERPNNRAYKPSPSWESDVISKPSIEKTEDAVEKPVDLSKVRSLAIQLLEESASLLVTIEFKNGRFAPRDFNQSQFNIILEYLKEKKNLTFFAPGIDGAEQPRCASNILDFQFFPNADESFIYIHNNNLLTWQSFKPSGEHKGKSDYLTFIPLGVYDLDANKLISNLNNIMLINNRWRFGEAIVYELTEGRFQYSEATILPEQLLINKINEIEDKEAGQTKTKLQRCGKKYIDIDLIDLNLDVGNSMRAVVLTGNDLILLQILDDGEKEFCTRIRLPKFDLHSFDLMNSLDPFIIKDERLIIDLRPKDDLLPDQPVQGVLLHPKMDAIEPVGAIGGEAGANTQLLQIGGGAFEDGLGTLSTIDFKKDDG